jgi:Holliday junction resolvasome RuvABC endonuclease subunit
MESSPTTADTLVVLAIDASTKTGWSLAEASGGAYRLLGFGKIGPIPKPEIEYPYSYLEWARVCGEEIGKLVWQYRPDVIVVEETASGSKSNFSQKILEFIHAEMAKLFWNYKQSRDFELVYFMTGEWRRVVNARLSSRESKQNKFVSKTKAKTGKKLAKDEKGKVVGRVTKKHVNVRRANELFGLNLKIKDNDQADAILLGKAWHEIKTSGVAAIHDMELT